MLSVLLIAAVTPLFQGVRVYFNNHEVVVVAGIINYNEVIVASQRDL